jgi:hypothetical protein
MSLRGYAADAPLLLVTDYPPGAGGGGAVILRSLLAGAAREQLVWASPSLPPDAAGLEAPLAAGGGVAQRLLGRRSSTIEMLLSARLAGSLRALAAARRARAVWIVMHGPMVHVAARFLAKKPLPVHLTVHDDPAFGVALMSRRHLPLVPLIERDFAYAMRRADSVDVIGEGMARRYRARYGIEPVVVHRGMRQPVPERPAPADDGHLEVGVMGNTYGYDQLPLLARAVEEAGRRVGRRGRIAILGQGPGERLRAEVAGRIDVDVTGHLDEGAAIERLERCFALYLNYPFSARGAVLRQTSFPTKLSSYVMAARPLLMHAPADSSVAHLGDLGAYVGWWRSERVEDGVAALSRLWNDPAAHASQHLAAERVRRMHYDLETNQAALFGALNGLIGA